MKPCSYHRIIPRLDIKGPNLVKGIHLEGLRVLGKPADFARFYSESGADELLYMDVVASLYGRNSLHDLISETARQIFVPLTVGGGLRTLDDISTVLRAGADKVSLNTAAIRNPEIIREAAQAFGSSTIVVAIEAVRQPDGTYLACTDNGREQTDVEVFEWAGQAEGLGAGEILLTSVDREGTGSGFDLDLIRQVSMQASIPVIAHGGAGSGRHVVEAIREGAADAVAVASMFHYAALANTGVSEISAAEGNTEFLRSRKGVTYLEPLSIEALKSFITSQGIACRNENGR